MKMRLALLLLALLPFQASLAHFQELIPSSDSISSPEQRLLKLQLRFTHPMEQGPIMNMAIPEQFGVAVQGQRQNLLDKLQITEKDGVRSYHSDYSIQRPGDHLFYLQPAPYWEPQENKWIVHFTKVVVDAFSGPQQWDQMIGFPVEIEPLVRPYGLWSHNLFRGIVRHNGKPVPFATIEVEWRNDGSVTAPTDAHVTQVIKADAQGVFSYAIPRSGWWGFAALIDGPSTPSPEGKDADLELGGLMWIYAHDMEPR